MAPPIRRFAESADPPASPNLAQVSRKYLIRTFGCQMNEHDSERIAGLFEADGMQSTASLDDADVVVLNTCCIRENADNKLYGTLGHLKAVKDARPDLEIVVGGCLAQKDRDLIQARAGHVDVVLGTHNVHRAVELLHQARLDGPVTEIWEETVLEESNAFPSALPARREVDFAAWVTIQIGCDNSCAFCIVPAVRGREISRPFGDLVAEVERLAADGVVEVTLLGQNVNSYGRDLTSRLRSEAPTSFDAHEAGAAWVAEGRRRIRPLFADLLRAVAEVEGIRRVRYTSPHPKDLRPETIDAMATHPQVCRHLHLPLQSGSDRILAAMHRGYTAERYLERLARARAAIDDLAVTTDIIVGFPGETEDDFERTLEVAAAAEYDSAYTFIYSPRSGTEAAELVDAFVPHDVAVERFERLRIVVERSALARHRARIGRVEEILVEVPEQEGRLGHDRSHRPEQARPPRRRWPDPASRHLRPGPHRRRRAHYLQGELVEVTASPRHRTRIPVVAV